MTSLRDLLLHAATRAADYREQAPDGPVFPTDVDLEKLRAALGSLGEEPTAAATVVDELADLVEPALVATTGPRYFGFVVGGALDAATAADVLTTGWDQIAFNASSSPGAAVVEDVAGGWLKDLLGLPAGASFGFVTGGQGANTVALAAARHHVLAGAGWDVEERGLSGGPSVRVVATAERHATIDRALRLLGLGAGVLEPVATDAHGAIEVADLTQVLAGRPAGPTIVCLQAGNVNSGAFDDLTAATAVAHEHGAWVHVDGAFGLWAAASPTTRHLTAGIETADSWSTDGHKWLNVPYDSGYAFCAHPDVARRGHVFHRRLPDRPRPGRSAGAVGLRDRVVAAGPRVRHVGRPSRARSERRGRPGRPVLRHGPPLRRAARLSPGGDRRQRRGAEPGARRLRRRRPDRPGGRSGPTLGGVLDGCHHVARSPAHADLGVELAHHRG